MKGRFFGKPLFREKGQKKCILQMRYRILAGNKVHLSEIVWSFNEMIPLKKTIDRRSRNLSVLKKRNRYGSIIYPWERNRWMKTMLLL